MDIIIYASDVRNLDEEIDKHLNIESEYGHALFDKNSRLTLENYNLPLEPHTYLSIMMDMQEQLNEQHDKINDLNSRLYNVEKI